MSISNETQVKDLSFPQSWRLQAAAERYNETVDKSERLETVGDLIKHQDQIIGLFGVGKKTFQYLFDALNEESC
jgi:hypothetical protein